MEVTFHAWKVNIASEGRVNALEQIQIPTFIINFLPVLERALLFIYIYIYKYIYIYSMYWKE